MLTAEHIKSIQNRLELMDMDELKKKTLYGNGPVWMCVLNRKPLPHMPPRKRKEFVYTQEAADLLGISYKDWWKCVKGDWGISEDGIVMQCNVVQQTVPNKKKPNEVNRKFDFGLSFHWCNFRDDRKITRKPLLAYDHINTGIIYRHSGKTRGQVLIKRPYVQEALLLWAKLWYLRAGKIKPHDALLVLHKAFPKKENEICHPVAYLNWWIGKHVHVRNYAAIMLKKIFREHGFGEDKAMQMLNETYKMAEKNGNSKEMLNVTKILLQVYAQPDSEDSDLPDGNLLGEAMQQSRQIQATVVNEEVVPAPDVVHEEADYEKATNMEGGATLAAMANENLE